MTLIRLYLLLRQKNEKKSVIFVLFVNAKELRTVPGGFFVHEKDMCIHFGRSASNACELSAIKPQQKHESADL